MGKRRITVTLDDGSVEAARAAVASGRSESISAFVNEALVARLERDRRMAALGEAIAEYEAEHGVITDEELAQQERADRDAAAAVRARLRRAG